MKKALAAITSFLTVTTEDWQPAIAVQLNGLAAPTVNIAESFAGDVHVWTPTVTTAPPLP